MKYTETIDITKEYKQDYADGFERIIKERQKQQKQSEMSIIKTFFPPLKNIVKL